MAISVMPIATSYEIICEAARAAPSIENLLFDDQPASIVPRMPMPETASTNRMPASSPATCIG